MIENNKESINIELNLEAEETTNKLEKIKQLLQDIQELDKDFSLSNVLEINNDSILIFNCKSMLRNDHIEDIERKLSQRLHVRCLVLDQFLKLDKAINNNYYKYNRHKDGSIPICPEAEKNIKNQK